MKWIAAVAVLTVGTGLNAEEQTRTDQILAERRKKQPNLKPEEPSRLEKKLNWFKDSRVEERLSDGFHGWRFKVGGLAPGGGFAVGPEFSRHGLWGGRFNVRAGAQASAKGYHKEDFHFGVPRLFNDRISLDVYAVHHNYSSLNYYGSGQDTSRAGRSAYRMEDTAVDTTLTVRVLPKLNVGGSAGYVWNNIGPGNDSRFVSTEQIYSDPGIDRQANFARVGAFVQYDYRDFAEGPRSGGNYIAQFHNFTDRTLGLEGFQRLDLEAQQYIPLFNKRRVIALRGKSVMTFTDDGKSVPFYMQPMLGGSDDLRGYRPFRFRGNNLLVMNAEYRWEVFSGLDMAVFGDAGKVFQHKSQFDLKGLETSAGFGFRFNARNVTFMRFDVGFSHEGYQISVKFNDLFRKGPVHTSSSQGDF
jgi:outer membrane protein assembly factor BamA